MIVHVSNHNHNIQLSGVSATQPMSVLVQVLKPASSDTLVEIKSSLRTDHVVQLEPGALGASMVNVLPHATVVQNHAPDHGHVNLPESQIKSNAFHVMKISATIMVPGPTGVHVQSRAAKVK